MRSSDQDSRRNQRSSSNIDIAFLSMIVKHLSDCTHVRPFSELGDWRTRLKDSNCHSVGITLTTLGDIWLLWGKRFLKLVFVALEHWVITVIKVQKLCVLLDNNMVHNFLNLSYNMCYGKILQEILKICVWILYLRLSIRSCSCSGSSLIRIFSCSIGLGGCFTSCVSRCRSFGSVRCCGLPCSIRCCGLPCSIRCCGFLCRIPSCGPLRCVLSSGSCRSVTGCCGLWCIFRSCGGYIFRCCGCVRIVIANIIRMSEMQFGVRIEIAKSIQSFFYLQQTSKYPSHLELLTSSNPDLGSISPPPSMMISPSLQRSKATHS